MKRKIIYPSLFAGLLLLLSIGFDSCIKDSGIDGCACVVTSLSNVKMRGGVLFDEGDAAIEKVRILVFHNTVNGEIERNRLYISGEEGFTNPFSLCGIYTGTKDVYLVANEPDNLTPALTGITKKSELLATLAPSINNPLSAPLMMTGYAEDQTIATGITTSVNIALTRVAAKISLKFKKDTDAEVKITKVSLLSNAKQATLFPAPPATGVVPQQFWEWSHTLPAAQVLTATATAISGQDTIYLYENLMADATDKTDATQLEMEALYDNIPVKYRVYLNEQVNDPEDPGYTPTPGYPYISEVDVTDHLYKIKRNYHYKFTGTIKGMGEIDGLLLQVKVLPWELIETEQLFEEQPVSIVTTPQFTSVDDNKTSIPQPLMFNFTLTGGPEGATWEATLDNGLEFGFEDVTQTYGVIGIQKTITIKPLKPFDELITRTTHFYITVTNPANGEKQKIKLVSGSDASQILITQVENL